MDINAVLAKVVDLYAEVGSLEDLALLEAKVKELAKAKKESFKEAVKTEAKTKKEEAKLAIRELMTDKDVNRMVKYTFGSGKHVETRVGKLLRAPSADHPTFSVEADDGKGGVKKLPRNATAFVGFAD